MSNSHIVNPPFPKQYAETFLGFARGRGAHLWDLSGRKYLDFGSGISVNALGYGRRDLARIAYRQMKRLIHVSNLYATVPAVRLAERLIQLGDFAAVHFGNSGSEANESALKFARLYGKRTYGDKRYKILCFEHAFHGRTMGALTCTPTEKYQKPFLPLIPGVEVGKFNDVSSIERLASGEFCAVIIEPVQGEGGLELVTPDFAAALNETCKKNDVALIADEVQTGIGRCGYDLASNAVGLEPDIVSLSKPLAGGLPLSATLIPAKINDLLGVGEHGTTFGGGPVTTSVALKVVETILNEEFLQSVRSKGDYLGVQLEAFTSKYKKIIGVKGLGLLRGLALDEESAAAIPDIIDRSKQAGLLILRSGSNVVRLAPPLVISEAEIDEGTAILDGVLSASIGAS